jgi:hypothetical protein
MQLCKRNFHLPPKFKESLYGFKTKQQQILLKDIGDLVKSKRNAEYIENLEAEQNFYDSNLKTDTIILRNLVVEANEAIQQIEIINKELKQQI